MREVRINTVTIGGQYGSVEASGSHPQQQAAKEMYHKITDQNIALKKAKTALQGACEQRKLGVPQYVTTSQQGKNFREATDFQSEAK